MKKVTFLIATVLAFSACIRMNDIAFYNNNSIDQYYFEDFEFDSEVPLGDEFALSEQYIHQVSINSIDSATGTIYKIAAVYIGELTNIPTDTILVYCHGQSEHLDYYWNRAKLLHFAGGPNKYGVLMMDYRGYGLSEGDPSEQGLYEDVSACLLWLKEQGAQEERTMLYGFSLGTAPAIQQAAYNSAFKVSKLIIESPMASADNLADESTLIGVSPDFFTDLSFNSAENIKGVSQPLLWMHGTADDYLKISNGELIYKNHTGEYKEAVRVEGAFHGANGVPETMGIDNYMQTVKAFLMRTE